MSPVASAFLIAAISAAASSCAIVRRTPEASKPTGRAPGPPPPAVPGPGRRRSTSTARPAATSAAHSAACCEPHVRTALAVSSSVLDKHERRPPAVERDRQLVGEVAVLRADRALVEPARQHVPGDPRRGQRVHLLGLGRKPRRARTFEQVVERQQPAQHDLRRGRADDWRTCSTPSTRYMRRAAMRAPRCGGHGAGSRSTAVRPRTCGTGG